MQFNPIDCRRTDGTYDLAAYRRAFIAENGQPVGQWALALQRRRKARQQAAPTGRPMGPRPGGRRYISPEDQRRSKEQAVQVRNANAKRGL